MLNKYLSQIGIKIPVSLLGRVIVFILIALTRHKAWVIVSVYIITQYHGEGNAVDLKLQCWGTN